MEQSLQTKNAKFKVLDGNILKCCPDQKVDS